MLDYGSENVKKFDSVVDVTAFVKEMEGKKYTEHPRFKQSGRNKANGRKK